MRAWRIHELGHPSTALRLDDIPTPEPGPMEVAITVTAGNVNFADILLCQGIYQDRPGVPFTPGLETSGTVVAAGPGADVRPGVRVAGMAALPAGGFAEHALVRADTVLEFPDDIPPADVTVLYSTYQTAHVGLHHRAGLRPGETLLVHAGAGGVGSAAVQLGVAAGARVIATAGGEAKVAACRSFGAHDAIDYLDVDVYEAVMSLTDGRGVDVAFDPVGGDVGDVDPPAHGLGGPAARDRLRVGRRPELPRQPRPREELLRRRAPLGRVRRARGPSRDRGRPRRPAPPLPGGLDPPARLRGGRPRRHPRRPRRAGGTAGERTARARPLTPLPRWRRGRRRSAGRRGGRYRGGGRLRQAVERGGRAVTPVLEGMRIIEGSAFVAAPLGGMTLGQLGADVIRFDAIGGGLDYGRWPVTDEGVSFFWTGLNKAKRSIQVDLRNPDGRDLIVQLITAPGPEAGSSCRTSPKQGGCPTRSCAATATTSST